MFTKIKHAFENWLRDIVAAEVMKIDTDLQHEKITLRAQVIAHDAAFKANLQSFTDKIATFRGAVKILPSVQERETLTEYVKGRERTRSGDRCHG
jgi:hypothetical protein